MPTRHRTSLCREGWYLLLLLAVVLTWALLRENNLLLLVAGLMCGALLVNWRLSAAAFRRVEVRRCVVSGAHAGSWMTIEVEVANGHRRLGCWAVSVEGCLERKDGRGDEQTVRPTLMFPCVSAGQCVRQSYRVRLPQRGRYARGRCASRRGSPSGSFKERFGWQAMTNSWCCRGWDGCGQPGCSIISRRRTARTGRGGRGMCRAISSRCGNGKPATVSAGCIGGAAPGTGSWWCASLNSPASANWRSCSICGNRTSRSRTSGSASNLPSASPPR